jgi:hypothetical protein
MSAQIKSRAATTAKGTAAAKAKGTAKGAASKAKSAPSSTRQKSPYGCRGKSSDDKYAQEVARQMLDARTKFAPHPTLSKAAVAHIG